MAKRTRGVCAPSLEREADFLDAVQVVCGVLAQLERCAWRTTHQLATLALIRQGLMRLVGMARAQDQEFWVEVHDGL